MSSHVWRPLLVVVALVAVLLVVRQIYVPDDFGIHQNGYSYGWYRQASIGDWKWLPVKYQGRDVLRAVSSEAGPCPGRDAARRHRV